MITSLNTRRGPITSRPTREGDAEVFRELRLEALHSHPESFGMAYAESLAQPITHWQERVRQGAGSERGITYVAEADGALVGMAGIFREDGAKVRHGGTIWGVYVRPAWRGQGLVDALIEACLGWAREQGLRLVRLSVTATNATAIRCYLRHGFSIYGVDPEVIHVDGHYYDELLMARRV